MADDEEVPVRPQVGGPDWLVSWAFAARTLGRTKETLGEWHDKYHVPAVRSPGNQLSTYASWLRAVMESPKPGVPGDIKEVTDEWWQQFEALRAAA